MSQPPAAPDPTVPLDTTPATPSDGPDKAPPWRLIPALAIGVVLLNMPYTGALVALLPARIAAVDPAHKVSLVAVVALTGAIVALLANILIGALSDLTRTRFGRRAPWIVLGALGGGATLWALGHATSGVSIILWWCVYQICYNAVVAPMVATLPDRVPLRLRGRYSSAYGAGTIVGGALGISVAGRMVLHAQTGFAVFAIMAVASGLLFAILAAEPSNRHVPRPAFSPSVLLHHFSFPRRGARDLYLALGGKLLQVIASYSAANFQLYILTDYIHLDLGRAGSLSSTVSLLGLPLAIVLGIVGGFVSDRINRRKILVMFSAFLAAIAMLFPFFAPQVWAFVTYGLITSAAQGVYGSVDQALNTEVLPDPETAAKDLGIVNISNTGGMVLGPAIGSIVVSSAGGYRALFIAAFVSLFLSALIIKPIRRSR